MISRVTHRTVQHSTLNNLQANLTKMARMQAEMSSGKKVARPSDDPSGTSDLLRMRAEQRATTQYGRNIDNGDAWMTTIDSALTTSLTTLRQARDLTIQGNNGSMGPESRKALATEIEGIRDALLNLANTQYQGRSVFAGTSNADQVFDPATFAFSGSSTGIVERKIGADTVVRVDSDGRTVFGEGADSVFALMDKIAADLRSDANLSANITAIDERMSALLTETASVGARHKQILGARDTNALTTQTLQSQIGGIEDIDLAETIMHLSNQEVAYKGALGAAAKVLQPTLLDYLR